MAEYKLPVFQTVEKTTLGDERLIVSDATPLPTTTAAGTSSVAKAEDAAHASGDTGTAILAVRRDAAAVGSGTDGDYSTVNVDATGRLWANTELPDAAALAEGAANPTTPTVGAAALHFNGTTFDRTRGNIGAELFASAARTASHDSADQTNYNARGIQLVIDVTAVVADPSVVFTIQGKDPSSGKYYTLLASAAIVGTGTTVLRIFPSATVTANVSANDFIPRTWRVSVAHADADSITYSVGYSLLN